jgi:hypothetical protein
MIIAVVTLSTFLHTYQRIEAVRYSYEINTNKIELNKLLDFEEELEYNVASLKAPTYLEMQLAKSDVKMVLPERWQVFESTGVLDNGADRRASRIVRNIVNIFSLKSEAQATPAGESHAVTPY